MAFKPGFLYDFPWKSLGNTPIKYVVLAPLVARAMQVHYAGSNDSNGNFANHLLILFLLRFVLGRLWHFVSRLPFWVSPLTIQRQGVSFEQVEREDSWDDSLLLQAMAFFALQEWLPGFAADMKPYDPRGLAIIALVHAGPVEFIYYWLHRALHQSPTLSQYHALHHASIVTEAVTAHLHTFAEHITFTALYALPLLTAYLLGHGSLAGLYAYFLVSDFLSLLAHCNLEFVPAQLFHALPFLKYFICTPTFHSLHHTSLTYNFSLHLPLYDYLGGTVDPAFDITHEKTCQYRPESVDLVFLAHGLFVHSIMHIPAIWPSYAKNSMEVTWYTLPFLPLFTVFYVLGTTLCDVFTAYRYFLRGLNLHTRIVPALGLNYFLPFGLDRLNGMIERAILLADRNGVKVFTLGALNKNEALNRGGLLFVERNPQLKVRICHGNTLTAAVVVNELKPGVQEVFLTGATSKLGRAISLYLARKGVRVLMLTNSRERFEKIAKEAPAEQKHLLVQVESAEAASNCKTWIAGKWLSRKEQSYAPRGTHFHQFVVPPITEYRSDCTYGKISQINLPKDTANVHACMLQLPRGSIFACFAGGIVHLLEGWTHHEVGPIDIDRIDVTWEAAMRHGFTPVK